MAELLRTESGDKRHFYLLLNKSTVLRNRTFFLLVQARQFHNPYWPRNSPPGNFRYWLFAHRYFDFFILFLFLFYYFIIFPKT